MSAEEDAAIERATRLRPIEEVAASLGLAREDLDLRGALVAKVKLAALARSARPQGKLVLVTAATPTVHGEGKTLTAIGLADALARQGKRAVVALREPSMGPVFGAKGCATGGGRAQVAPREGINLHFTRDFDAVAAAQNLVVALIDAHVFHGNALDVDPARVVLPRALDVNDRQLRHIVSGLGGSAHGVPREDGFVITAATEMMAVLALASDVADLKTRVARMTVAYDRSGAPVTIGRLGATGAVAVLLKGAIRPNLVQTLEGTPALVHAGPFANIAHGASSLVAARLGLATADVVVTEAGFGADLGAEKFVDLVVAETGLPLDLAVLVVTVRGLAHHGPTLEEGLANLDAHLALLDRLGVRVVVTVNRFAGDSEADVKSVLAHCAARRVPAAVHTCHADGGAGGVELARVVLDALAHPSTAPTPLYGREDPIETKAEKVVRALGGAGVEFEPAAAATLERLRAQGLGTMPICIAKTQYSLSDDAKTRGAPRGWTLHVREVRPETGAGWVVLVAGSTVLMPGLGDDPQALHMDVADDGSIVGLR